MCKKLQVSAANNASYAMLVILDDSFLYVHIKAQQEQLFMHDRAFSYASQDDISLVASRRVRF